MKWQPIETAPKDERILLVWGDGVIVVGEWTDDEYAAKPRPCWECDRSHLFGKLWTRKTQPTHWMPLPEPSGGAR